jgi:hypothetical protein
VIIARTEVVLAPEARSLSVEAGLVTGGAIEILLGGSLDPDYQVPPLKRVRTMGRQIILHRFEQAKVLRCGPVRLLPGGSLSVRGRTLELSDVPKAGMEIAGVTLVRPSPELLGVQGGGRLFCFSYERGAWYYPRTPLETR